jgi:hypothetical protein
MHGVKEVMIMGVMVVVMVVVSWVIWVIFKEVVDILKSGGHVKRIEPMSVGVPVDTTMGVVLVVAIILALLCIFIVFLVQIELHFFQVAEIISYGLVFAVKVHAAVFTQRAPCELVSTVRANVHTVGFIVTYITQPGSAETTLEQPFVGNPVCLDCLVFFFSPFDVLLGAFIYWHKLNASYEYLRQLFDLKRIISSGCCIYSGFRNCITLTTNAGAGIALTALRQSGHVLDRLFGKNQLQRH